MRGGGETFSRLIEAFSSSRQGKGFDCASLLCLGGLVLLCSGEKKPFSSSSEPYQKETEDVV